MRFWRQAELFGIGDQDSRWFVPVCERLAALCAYDLDSFFKDLGTRSSFRFHEIDWKGKKVPVDRKFFDWVAKEYLDNEQDFPFFQCKRTIRGTCSLKIE
ncbi:hypothetical protein WMC41_11900 [Shinella yambaruensis]|uniref:hypothetical protein n=1 Tax=Shinella yambaruensis TaxID=415996 RepID=UPI003D7A6411